MNGELVKANDFYKQAQATSGVSRVLKQSCLEKAIRLYRQQLSSLTTHDSRSSVLRNIGMANMKLADVVESSGPTAELQLVIFYLKEAIESFANALAFRPGDMSTEWGIAVDQRILDCFEVAFRLAGGRDIENERMRSSLLDTLFEGIPPLPLFDTVRAKCHLAKAQYFYRSSVVSLERCNFRAAVQFLEYSREETELAMKSGQNEDVLNEISLMQQEIYASLCCCESVRVRFQADQLFTEQVKESEEINFEMMWVILDMYKDAVLQTKERDIENEALALSRLGRMFDKIFKIKDKSHAYYRRSFNLAQTLLPKNIETLEWFRETRDAIERFQKTTVQEEERRREAENAPFLKKLAPELAELKKIADERNAFSLLRFLYKKFPPKVKYEFKEKELNETTVKSFLMKAITHYHPDKQVNFGKVWQVFCGEITKYLTVRYECFK